MAKVTVSTKIDEKLKEKLEIRAKENEQTLSQLIGENLKKAVEKEESSSNEFSLVKSELAEKNKQIGRLQEQISNQQKIALYDKKERAVLLGYSEENQTVVNEKDSREKEISELKEQLADKMSQLKKMEEEQKRKDRWKFWKK
jgi:predicted transcriptional regulator